jgi:phytoene synthase
MTPLDPDRTLALSYVPTARRAAVGALWYLDAALGAVVSGGKEPMIARIKLAWWREALERLDHAPPPAEPTLEAAAVYLLPRGLSGAELSAMEGGWTVLLGEDALSAEELQAYAAERGATLFRLTARLLGAEVSSEQVEAGQCWALADLARHSGEPDSGAALAAARGLVREEKWPSTLRPLGMLAILAARDVRADVPEPPGSPTRMLRMLKHRITGR